MSKSSQIKKSACKLVNKPQAAVPADPNLSERYILVCSKMFDQILGYQGAFSCIEVSSLREENVRYADLKEDKWSRNPAYSAALWMHQDTSAFLLYVDHQGRLYCCKDIFQAVEIINDLKTQEALKIIPSNT